MAPLIEVSDADRVRWVTINRPDRLNALNSQVLAELHDVVVAAQDTPAVGCIVVRGAGSRAFCAGADLEEICGLSSEPAQAFIARGHRTMDAVEASRVPVLAAVDGYALGGGFELALACHLVVASRGATFGLPEAKIGCMPGFGGTQRLLLTVGRAPAFHLLLTGVSVDAARAWEIGLLSVPPVDDEAFDDTVRELAALVAAGSRTGIRSILEAARAAARPQALAQEAALAALAIASADGQEGITAFAERRAPKFTGGGRVTGGGRAKSTGGGRITGGGRA